MQSYIGTKRINGEPMTRQAYNDFRGWCLPPDENGADEGYLVEYVNGGPANTSAYAGYVSWSPKEVFDQAYRQTDALTFGEALEALKMGNKVARQGWNGKGMFLYLVDGSTFEVNRPPLNSLYPEGTHCTYQPHVDMKTADGSLVPWLCSQSDMLAEDWEIVE